MNSIKPLVSVILPNYNHAIFLKKRIDSILNQSFTNFELIILDDCSTDNSIDIIKSYIPNKKITQIILNEKNSGSPFLQWQKGFNLAKGEYIWIAESDDYSDITFLEKLVPLLENNQQCSIAFCGSNIIDKDENILSDNWDKYKENEENTIFFQGKDFIRKKMLFYNSIYNAGIAVFRKNVLENLTNDYINFKFCGDWLFWSQMCMNGNIIRYCEKMNYYRQHSNKVSPKAKSNGINFKEEKYVVNYLINNSDLSQIQKKIVIGRLLKRIKNSKDLKNKEIKKSILKETKEYFNYPLLPIFLYNLDKRINFSSLDIRKNRYL